MITTIDKLKFGQKFERKGKVYKFLYSKHDISVFTSKEKKYTGTFYDLTDLELMINIRSHITREFVEKIKNAMIEMELETISWWGSVSDKRVRLLCIKNNKLNQKLYPNNEITECGKYINL